MPPIDLLILEPPLSPFLNFDIDLQSHFPRETSTFYILNYIGYSTQYRQKSALLKNNWIG